MKLNRKKIRREMVRLKWNQSRLAKEMNVSRQRVHQILNDDGNSSLDNIQRIGQTLGIDPKDLLM